MKCQQIIVLALLKISLILLVSVTVFTDRAYRDGFEKRLGQRYTIYGVIRKCYYPGQREFLPEDVDPVYQKIVELQTRYSGYSSPVNFQRYELNSYEVRSFTNDIGFTDSLLTSGDGINAYCGFEFFEHSRAFIIMSIAATLIVALQMAHIATASILRTSFWARDYFRICLGLSGLALTVTVIAGIFNLLDYLAAPMSFAEQEFLMYFLIRLGLSAISIIFLIAVTVYTCFTGKSIQSYLLGKSDEVEPVVAPAHWGAPTPPPYSVAPQHAYFAHYPNSHMFPQNGAIQHPHQFGHSMVVDPMYFNQSVSVVGQPVLEEGKGLTTKG